MRTSQAVYTVLKCNISYRKGVKTTRRREWMHQCKKAQKREEEEEEEDKLSETNSIFSAHETVSNCYQFVKD